MPPDIVSELVSKLRLKGEAFPDEYPEDLQEAVSELLSAIDTSPPDSKPETVPPKQAATPPNASAPAVRIRPEPPPLPLGSGISAARRAHLPWGMAFGRLGGRPARKNGTVTPTRTTSAPLADLMWERSHCHCTGVVDSLDSPYEATTARPPEGFFAIAVILLRGDLT